MTLLKHPIDTIKQDKLADYIIINVYDEQIRKQIDRVKYKQIVSYEGHSIV